MKVSILGNNLTSLTLAKALVNQGIRVDIFSDYKLKINNNIQTLGISRTNVNFFNKKILDIKKLVWNINKIEIFSENLRNEKILNFEKDNDQLFSIIKNAELYKHLSTALKKHKLVQFKKDINKKILLNDDYKLVFNCDFNSSLTRKFFYKNIIKDYKSLAYVSSFTHRKIKNNHTATQIFTKKGPLAFLPISSNETSVVYSVKGKQKLDLDSLVKKYNTKYEIINMNNFLSFELKSSNLRSYYKGKIIAFGDLLHRLHPLAGQGFNMTIRDIKEIIRLIEFKKEHGLDLDTSICFDFEKNMKDKNYIFSNGIDFIYEAFNFENKINTKNFSRSLKFFGKNKMFNSFFTQFADKGFI